MTGFEQRELIAFAIIAVVALGVGGRWAVTRRRRRIEKLRRRGIKTYGH